MKFKCNYFKTCIPALALLLLSSCSELLFEKPMPLKGNVQKEIPAFFNGEFIELYFTDYSVSAHIYEIDKSSNYACKIYKTENKYLDSLAWSKTNLGKIDTVTFKNNQLNILGKNSTLNLNLSDSIASTPKKIDYEINLKDQYFNFNFGNMPLDETKREKCELKKLKNLFFLNIQKSKKHWVVVKIEPTDEDILFTPSTFFGKEEHRNLESIIKKYKLTDVSVSNGKFKITKYLANLNDNEFEEIINRRDIFKGARWCKIKNYNTVYLIFTFLVFFLTPIIIYYAKDRN